MRFTRKIKTTEPYNYTPLSEPLNVEKVDCIVCLSEKDEIILHFSSLTNQCSCNYHIHRSCLIQWVEIKYPEKGVCLLCKKEITSNDIVGELDTRLATENHPLSMYHPNNRGNIVLQHGNYYPEGNEFRRTNDQECLNTVLQRVLFSFFMVGTLGFLFIYFVTSL